MAACSPDGIDALAHRTRTREALLDAGVAVAEHTAWRAECQPRRGARRASRREPSTSTSPTGRRSSTPCTQRFHARVQAAVAEATAVDAARRRADRARRRGLPRRVPGRRAVKALALEARTDPSLTASMAARHERFAAAARAELQGDGLARRRAAAQLLAAMTAEIAVRELDAGRRLPAAGARCAASLESLR